MLSIGLTQRQINRIIELKNQGHTRAGIAKRYHYTREQINYALTQHREEKQRALTAPKRCPDCGQRITIEPCLECNIEKKKQSQRLVRAARLESVASKS